VPVLILPIDSIPGFYSLYCPGLAIWVRGGGMNRGRSTWSVSACCCNGHNCRWQSWCLLERERRPMPCHALTSTYSRAGPGGQSRLAVGTKITFSLSTRKRESCLAMLTCLAKPCRPPTSKTHGPYNQRAPLAARYKEPKNKKEPPANPSFP